MPHILDNDIAKVRRSWEAIEILDAPHKSSQKLLPRHILGVLPTKPNAAYGLRNGVRHRLPTAASLYVSAPCQAFANKLKYNLNINTVRN